MESLLLFKIPYLVTIIGSTVIFLFLLFKNLADRFQLFYALTNASVIIWAIGRYALLVADNQDQAFIWVHILYIGSILVHIFFLHAVFIFLGIERKRKWLLYILYANAFVISAVNIVDLSFGTNLFIADIGQKLFFPFYESPGLWYALHLLQYLFIPQYALIEMLLALRRARSDRIRRIQLWLVIVSSIAGFIGGNTVVFLVYDIPILPLGIIFVPINFIAMTYAILRFHLINFKIIATELFTFVILTTLFIQAVFSETLFEALLRSFFALVVTLFSYLLIKSVYREVEQREEIEILAKDLEKANVRLKELDKLKSEFVSIASHQLRSPLTSVKGYASLILEGSFGKVTDSVKEAVQRIFDASQTMVASVEDFLNVSRIEQGRMKYEMSVFDVGELAEKVIEENRPAADKKKLKLTYTAQSKDNTIKADLGKIKQVINNLIDNAIKYTEKGNVDVNVSRRESIIRIAITDTGVGISKETLPRLFDRFVRDKDARKVNVSGSGLGLYVAKQLVEGHKGKIWAESEGEGRGSRFIVELPAS